MKFNSKKHYIICSAIKINNRLYLGNNHGDIIQNINFKEGEKAYSDTQGFIDNCGKFVNRVEALKIAKDCGQVSKNFKEDELCSEHIENKLWLLKDIF